MINMLAIRKIFKFSGFFILIWILAQRLSAEESTEMKSENPDIEIIHDQPTAANENQNTQNNPVNETEPVTNTDTTESDNLNVNDEETGNQDHKETGVSHENSEEKNDEIPIIKDEKTDNPDELNEEAADSGNEIEFTDEPKPDEIKAIDGRENIVTNEDDNKLKIKDDHKKFESFLNAIISTDNMTGLYGGFTGEFYGYNTSIFSTGVGFGARLEWRHSPYLSGVLRFSSGLIDLRSVDIDAVDSSQNPYVISLSSGSNIGFISGSLGIGVSYPLLNFMSLGLGMNFNLTRFQAAEFDFSFNPGFEMELSTIFSIIKNMQFGITASYRLMEASSIIINGNAYNLLDTLNSSSLQVQAFMTYKLFGLGITK